MLYICTCLDYLKSNFLLFRCYYFYYTDMRFVFVQIAEDENVEVDPKFRALVAVGSLVFLSFYL